MHEIFKGRSIKECHNNKISHIRRMHCNVIESPKMMKWLHYLLLPKTEINFNIFLSLFSIIN